jgi:ankyrin repeat protein
MEALFGYPQVVELLLEFGADTALVDKDRRTPLLGAARYGFEKCVEVITKHALRDSERGASAALTVQDGEGQTALALAARYGHERVVRQLVALSRVSSQIDVGINIADKRGDTPLLIAARRGNDMVMPNLLEAKPRRHRNRQGMTALMFAARAGHYAAAEVLVHANGIGAEDLADFFATNEEGQTPLGLAARGGHELLVKSVTSTSPSPRRPLTPPPLHAR